MIKKITGILAGIFILFNQSHAQDKGILALTGARYYKEGISAKSIDIRVDGSFLLNNRVPLNKEIEIKLQAPAGFTDDKSKTIFAGAELNILSLKGTVLFKVPNIFKDNEAKGFPANNFKEFSVRVPLKVDFMKAEPGCIVKIRFYDLKGKNQLRVELPVTIARPGEPAQLSKAVTDIKSSVPAEATSVGLKIKNILVTVDTSIRVSPKMAYASLDITGIEGTSMSEVLSGKESFWVYDSDLNEVKITDKQLKQVKGAMEDNLVDYLSKIPFRLKTVNNKSFFVRFRWESSDKRKLIDVVVAR